MERRRSKAKRGGNHRLGCTTKKKHRHTLRIERAGMTSKGRRGRGERGEGRDYRRRERGDSPRLPPCEKRMGFECHDEAGSGSPSRMQKREREREREREGEGRRGKGEDIQGDKEVDGEIGGRERERQPTPTKNTPKKKKKRKKGKEGKEGEKERTRHGPVGL